MQTSQDFVLGKSQVFFSVFYFSYFLSVKTHTHTHTHTPLTPDSQPHGGLVPENYAL